MTSTPVLSPKRLAAALSTLIGVVSVAAVGHSAQASAAPAAAPAVVAAGNVSVTAPLFYFFPTGQTGGMTTSCTGIGRNTTSPYYTLSDCGFFSFTATGETGTLTAKLFSEDATTPFASQAVDAGNTAGTYTTDITPLASWPAGAVRIVVSDTAGVIGEGDIGFDALLTTFGTTTPVDPGSPFTVKGTVTEEDQATLTPAETAVPAAFDLDVKDSTGTLLYAKAVTAGTDGTFTVVVPGSVTANQISSSGKVLSVGADHAKYVDAGTTYAGKFSGVTSQTINSSSATPTTSASTTPTTSASTTPTTSASTTPTTSASTTPTTTSTVSTTPTTTPTTTVTPSSIPTVTVTTTSTATATATTTTTTTATATATSTTTATTTATPAPAANHAPTARGVVAPMVVYVGQPVSLDGSHSTDPETASSRLTYVWDYGNFGTKKDSTSARATAHYRGRGLRTATLKVTDPQGLTSTVSFPIVVLKRVQCENQAVHTHGTFEVTSLGRAPGGAYCDNLKHPKNSHQAKAQDRMSFVFAGTLLRINYGTRQDGGSAEVYIDGKPAGSLDFHSNSPTLSFSHRYAMFGGLEQSNYYQLRIVVRSGSAFIDSFSF